MHGSGDGWTDCRAKRRFTDEPEPNASREMLQFLLRVGMAVRREPKVA